MIGKLVANMMVKPHQSSLFDNPNIHHHQRPHHLYQFPKPHCYQNIFTPQKPYIAKMATHFPGFPTDQ